MTPSSCSRLASFALALFAPIACANPGVRSAEQPAAQNAHETSRNAPSDARGAANVEPKFFALKVEGFEPAVLAVPGGPPRRRPLLIAAHGAGGAPEDDCALWAEIVAGRGVVVCPRGVALSARYEGAYYFPNHHHLERELQAILRSVRGALSELVDDGPVVYAGYSQGGIMGALVARQHPSLLSRLVLVEGGALEWDVPTANKFRRGGGERVLLVCGQGGCARAAARAKGWLERAGVAARAEHVSGAGHTTFGPVAERLRETFEWVVEGDARWRAP
jgi:predicted esterase